MNPLVDDSRNLLLGWTWQLPPSVQECHLGVVMSSRECFCLFPALLRPWDGAGMDSAASSRHLLLLRADQARRAGKLPTEGRERRTREQSPGEERWRGRGESKASHGRAGGSVPLPARIQRILSMVRADVKLPPYPCSLPVSLFPELGSSSSWGCRCLLVFLFPPGRVGGPGRRPGGRRSGLGFGTARGLPAGMVMCLCCTSFPGPIPARADSRLPKNSGQSLLPSHGTSQAPQRLSPAPPPRPRAAPPAAGSPPDRHHAGLFQGVLPLPQQLRVGKALSPTSGLGDGFGGRQRVKSE